MIKNFRHKGLEAFFHNGSKAGIQPHHAGKLRLLLSALDNAKHLEDMNVPSWKLHALTGNMAGHFALTVNGNWRLTFTFDGKDSELVDYQDYH